MGRYFWRKLENHKIESKEVIRQKGVIALDGYLASKIIENFWCCEYDAYTGDYMAGMP